MQQFRRKPVGNVHHCRGLDSGFRQAFDNVAPCFRFQETFQQVFFSCKVGLHILFSLEHGFLTFHQLEAHVGSSQVACHANQVGFFRTVAVHNLVFCRLADAGDRNGKPCDRRSGITSYDVHMVLAARQLHPVVEVFEVLYAEAFRYGKRYGDLLGHPVHGIDIREVHHCRLVSQVLQRSIYQVEMYAFHQQVGSNQYLFIRIGEYGGVIAYAVHRLLVLQFNIFRQTLD